LKRHPSLRDCCILVVEDDFYLAEDIADTLRNEGAHILGPAASVQDAFTLLQEKRPDAAVLDVNLGLGTSFELGRALRSRDVPILFATGYEAKIIPRDLSDAPHLIKPLNMNILVAKLVEIAVIAGR
jgi:DNA-binding response OmpR family regulator